jgi:HlyD family secretion protein
MLVYAKVDESDVGRIRSGQKVTFKVDAFPKEEFTGTVTQVRMNPTTVQNVVTYDTVIEFANRDGKLFPGMTAYVTIPVATVENVLAVPNAAIRYKPSMTPEAVRALYARYGLGDRDEKDRPGLARQEAVVWKPHADGSLEPVKIALGITDHTITEVSRVLAGNLEPGDELVTSSVAAKSLPPAPGGIRR